MKFISIIIVYLITSLLSILNLMLLNGDNYLWLIQFLYYTRGIIISIIIIYAANNLDDKGLLNGLYQGYVITITFLSGIIISSNFFGTSSVKEIVGNVNLIREYTGFTGLYSNPNYWSIYVVLGAALCSYRIINIDVKFKSNFIPLLYLILSFIYTISTGSRMGILAIAVLFIINLLYIFRGQYHRSFFTYSSIKSIAVFIILIFLSFVFSDVYHILSFIKEIDITALVKTIDRFDRLVNYADEESRLERAIVYMNLITDNPYSLIFGLGLGATIESGPPHNTLIKILVDFGLIGLILFSCVIFAKITIFLRYKFSRQHNFIILVFLLLIGIFSLTNDVIESRNFWVIIGVILSLKKGGFNMSNDKSNNFYEVKKTKKNYLRLILDTKSK